MLKTILKKIKPTRKEKEEVKRVVKTFLDKLNNKLTNAKAIIGGSGAKDTWLKGNHDIDIFVQFAYGSKDISNKLEKVLKKLFKVERLHGSRDYFQVEYSNFVFEIIPILKINNADEAKNITDISPLHAEWVNKHDYKDDIRLMKQFCKANNVYGAESYIKGFSGYDIEILVIYYRGFMNAVKEISKWGKRVIIDAENHYKDEKEVIKEMNTAKIVSPLIIVDPVQKSRNVAAALSSEKFEKFKTVCRRFLKQKSPEFFEIKEISIEDLKKKAGKNKLILFDVETIDNKKDVAGSKMVKAFEYIGKRFSINDFSVINEGWKWDEKRKALFWYIIEDEILPEYETWEGPPVKAKKHAGAFRKAHKNAYAEDGRLYARVKRKFRKADNLAKALVKDEYMKDKVKKIKMAN